MKKVNLRDLYPDVYKNDHFVEVTEDVLETIRAAERVEAAYDRRMYRYKAHYSLDCDNGIENAILLKPQTPEMLLEEKQLREQLYAAVMALPEKQAKRKQKAIAIMRDCPTSPRKMRLVADIIRGVEINKALGILRYSKKEASIRMEKLLKSAIANWEAKNENERLEDTKLCVKEIFVDGGRMLKRIQAAPQGRAHRIRKRSNHVTIVVDKMVTEEKK